MDDFYIYVILNLEEPGDFKYGDIKFDHLPIYIGKGKNKRQFTHFKNYSLKGESEKSKSLLKYNCVSQIFKNNLSESESFKLEREYIELIGRKNIDKGPLLNLTSGGQGASGYKYTPEQILARSKRQSTTGNIFYGKKHNIGAFNKFKRPVYQIDTNTGEIINKFDSLSDASSKTNSNETHIRNCCNGNRIIHNGFKWKDVESYIKKSTIKGNNTQKRKVSQLDLDGNIINEYESISSASKITGIIKSNIINCLSGNKQSAGGFKWSYKNESTKFDE